jgi:hypothetical protein
MLIYGLKEHPQTLKMGKNFRVFSIFGPNILDPTQTFVQWDAMRNCTLPGNKFLCNFLAHSGTTPI